MISPDQWNALVAKAPGGSFLQSWEWGEFQRELGIPYWRLTADDGVALVLRRNLAAGQGWLYIPRGPASAEAPAGKPVLDQIQELAAKQKVLFLRTEPSAPPAGKWRKADHNVQPAHTVVLDVTKTEEELLAGMHQKTRYNINLARRHGVTARFSTAAEDIEAFLRLSREVSERGQFHFHPDAYYRAMHRALSPTGVFEIAVAEHAGVPLAAHLLISFAGTTTYVHGASSSAGRQHMAPHLLQWESIQRAKAQGAKHYDFFGIAPADASAPADKPDHPWAGITRFKLGFGGQRVDYPGAWDLILEPIGYWLYTVGRRARAWVR
jgi:peptidoglycan pentaglycine glycine transferase (the first glycine)